MPSPTPKESTTPPPHISITDPASTDSADHDTPKTPRSSSGWDGKLRLEKNVELVNPEAISDAEYTDEENVLPGEQIDADEGTELRFCLYCHARKKEDSKVCCWKSSTNASIARRQSSNSRRKTEHTKENILLTPPPPQTS